VSKLPRKTSRPRLDADGRRKKQAGEVILKAIKAAGFTIRSFSRSIKVEASTVSRWCAGKRFPGRTMLRLLHEKLGVTLGDLV
jgi:transcriptional regulator with XRE-family HTH domain